MPSVYIKRHRNSSLVFNFRIHARPTRKTRPVVPFADHQTERGPEIVMGDSERGLGFLSKRRSAPEEGRHGDGDLLSSYRVGEKRQDVGQRNTQFT